YRGSWAVNVYNLGIALAKNGKFAEAEAPFRQARDVLKELYARYGARPPARREVQGPRSRPEDTLAVPLLLDFRYALESAYPKLCQVLARAPERAEELDQLYREAIAVLPDSPELNNNLAWWRATCPDPKYRDPADAVRRAEKAVQLAPEKGDHWNTLGT